MDALLPVLALIVGWCLSGANTMLASREQLRRKLKLAVADLLEIRHFLKAYTVIVNQIEKIAVLPENDAAQIRLMIFKIIPLDENLDKRYSETINSICEADPYIGFKLRSINLIRGFLHILSSIQVQKPPEFPPFPDINKVITDDTLPRLQEIILSITWRFDIFLWWKLKRHFSSSVQIPPEVENMVESLKKTIVNLSKP